MPRKEVTVIISPNYRAESTRLTLPLWVARLLVAFAVFLSLVVTASLVMAFAGAYRLSRLAYLERRNHQLEAEYNKVTQLRKDLEELEQQTHSMATVLGIEKTPPPPDWDSAPYDSSTMPEWLKVDKWGARSLPVIVPVEGYAVSQSKTDGHTGIDLAAESGTPVRATADGIIEQTGTDRVYGRFVRLGHGQGYESYYGHLSDWNVSRGDTVRAGQTIGWVGSTGRSTAPHLHFEIRKDGQPIDPTTLLKF